MNAVGERAVFCASKFKSYAGFNNKSIKILHAVFVKLLTAILLEKLNLVFVII